jgi:hypothetical protein
MNPLPAPLSYQRRPQVGNVSIDTTGGGVSIVLHAQPMGRRNVIDILIIHVIAFAFALFAAFILGVLTGRQAVAAIALVVWLVWSVISWRRQLAIARAATSSITATPEGFEQTYSRGRAEPLKIPRASIADVVARMSHPDHKAEPVTLLLRFTTGQEIEIGRGSLDEADALEAALREGLRLPKKEDFP